MHDQPCALWYLASDFSHPRNIEHRFLRIDSVHRSETYGKGIHTGSFCELGCHIRVGEGLFNLISSKESRPAVGILRRTAHGSKFCLHGEPHLVGRLGKFPDSRDIFLKRKVTAVIHDAGISAPNPSHNKTHVNAVIQMYTYRSRCPFCILHRLGTDIFDWNQTVMNLDVADNHRHRKFTGSIHSRSRHLKVGNIEAGNCVPSFFRLF